MIDRGVHMSVVEKKFESYFRDRLTFSNIDSWTSRRIYRLALLLRAPETLSSLSKSRISIFNAHLMHLSIACPTTPLTGLGGEIARRLQQFFQWLGPQHRGL